MQCLEKSFEHTLVEHYQVKFRNLSAPEIERYVDLDLPLECAGSFKCESLGISLFEKMIGQDQTTLMGFTHDSALSDFKTTQSPNSLIFISLFIGYFHDRSFNRFRRYYC